jgi:hydrogenase/urease accessory protein HupE
LLQHLRVFADDQRLLGKRSGMVMPQAGSEAARAIYDFEFPIARKPRAWRVEEDVLREVEFAPGNRWEATYVVRVRAGADVLVDGALLTATMPLLISASSHSGSWRIARDYFRHGVMHILTGYDHLLFIGALALAVTTFWELFKVIAAFTAAHTVTLTLSVLNIVRLPSHVVEPMIAASIVFVALQNVFWPRRSHGTSRLSVAFFFGLFHGLGFAGGLLDAMAGMPGVGIGLAIVAFSVGVEIGHQCIVLPLFVLTHSVRFWQRHGHGKMMAAKASEILLRGGSALIGAAGMFYLISALTQWANVR